VRAAVDHLPEPVEWPDNESVRHLGWRQTPIWLFAVLAGPCFVVAAYLAISYPPAHESESNSGLVWLLAGPLPFFVVGMLAHLRVEVCLLSRQLLWVGGTFGIAGAIGYGVTAGVQVGADAGWLGVGVFGYQLACMIAIVLLARTLTLLPTGLFRYRYEWMTIRAMWAVPSLSVIIFFAGPTAYLDHAVFLGDVPGPPSPLPSLPWLAGPVAAAYEYYWLASFVGVALFLVRAARMTPAERRTVRAILVVLGLITAELTALAIIASRLPEPIPVAMLPRSYFGLFPFVAILAAVVVAGIRNGALGGGVAIQRSLVYTGLWLLIAVGYLGLATALGLAATTRLPIVVAILATVAATVVLEPVRRKVNAFAERQVLGRRLSGYELLVRLGGTMEHAFRPHELADELAGGLLDGLGLDWAQVRLDDYVATAGTVVGDPAAERPLRHDGVALGMISCGPKSDSAFTVRDLELIETLARQAGLALHHARQTAELEASRARIVQAQDAERRRIEQDLHDGVQQELVAVVAKLGLARSVLPRDPSRSLVLIREVQDEAVRIVDELRELAHGIHPSVLSDEGLVAAVESRARRMPIPAAVTAPDGLRGARFAIEVEASAYYFVSESLTNVLKHAGATAVAINFAATNGSLLVEVRDNGSGLPAAVRSGSGLTALRDRIEAVGGSLRVANGTGGGAAVHARLPSGAVSG
jgi:signal transduction histidine kinase